MENLLETELCLEKLSELQLSNCEQIAICDLQFFADDVTVMQCWGSFEVFEVCWGVLFIQHCLNTTTPPFGNPSNATRPGKQIPCILSNGY